MKKTKPIQKVISRAQWWMITNVNNEPTEYLVMFSTKAAALKNYLGTVQRTVKGRRTWKECYANGDRCIKVWVYSAPGYRAKD